ncbi:chemotaxis protein CheB [Archangium sp.]|uniref:chemotaxis protein CheB n=1 Tax=Archangium sp. TaxID=1872627 RepID=UPI002D72B3F7|nr:chemotaxis protein CheB [Archangium sp.]HYO55810.1 chemotaxis protein CheB [Archangium sp.]
MEAGASAYRVLLVGEVLRGASRGLFDGVVLAPAGNVCEFSEALEGVQRLHPDVVVVDLSGQEALKAIERVMAERPVPVLALHPGVLSGAEAFQALAFGAVDVVDRPAEPGVDFWQTVGRKLMLLAEVRVSRPMQVQKPNVRPPPTDAPFPLVVIASSLGGPKALSVVLRGLPKGFPAPVCICQHISDGFTEGLAQWLGSESPLRVVEATDGEEMVPGSVYIARSGSHLVVRSGGRLALDPSPPVRGFRPSCDVLLMSAAESFGTRVLGVILTGMGRDGARGLKEIRERGGRTIAQDKASCAVYGMPKEAVRLGAAEEVLPLEQIGPTLIQWVQTC